MERNGGGSGGGFSIIEEKTVPDFYTDSTTFELSLYGVTLEFGQTRRPPAGRGGKPPHIPRVRVHMSPLHAKVVAKLLAKNLRAYEEKLGRITLPPEVLRDLGIEDDWNR